MWYDVKHYDKLIGSFPDLETACRAAQLYADADGLTLAVINGYTKRVIAVYSQPRDKGGCTGG